jgi:hypothetical protein
MELAKPNFNSPAIDDRKTNLFAAAWQRLFGNWFEALQVIDGGTP